MRKIVLFGVLCNFFIFLQGHIQAQNGPGGAGNSNGSSGQPQNVLWLDANTLGLTDGTAVSTWTDRSGNGYVFGASTGNTTTASGDGNSSQFPSFESDASSTINGFPVVRFDDTNQERLTIHPFSGFPNAEITILIVFKTANSSEGIVSYAVSGSDNELLIFDANAIRTYINGDATNIGGDFNTPSNTKNIFLSRWNSAGGTIQHYKNGLEVFNSTSSTTSMADGGALVLGGEQDAVDDGYATNQNFGGDIAEIIIYDTYLNEAQKTLVENYLSEKYNITLDVSVTDAYGNGAGYNTAYNYDIGGVGKNGIDVHEEGGSAGFYLSVKSIAMLNDGDYVMAGHNNGGKGSSTINLSGTSPAITHRWERDWYLEKTSPSSVGSNIYLEFDFPDGITGGQYPQDLTNYYLLYRATASGNYSVVTVTGKTKVNGDRVRFELTEAQLADGYYTMGTSDNSDSPIAGGPGKVWYSYTSGNWADANTWTLDGSAFPDYDNPSSKTPEAQDSVVITDSKTVTIQSTTNNITIAGLEVIGTLDLTSSSGHNFTSISGAGTIRLEGSSGSVNFATATVTEFADATNGGTVEIYGSGLDLDQSLTLNNLIINLDNSTDQVIVLADYTLNGNLEIRSGTCQINDGAVATNLNFTINGDLMVEGSGRIRVGNANQRHQLNLYGDFTNQGTAYFTNRTLADYANEAADGIVDVNFLNKSAHQQIQCDGECRFYRIEIDKAESTDANATYILDINASSTANFNLFGYANQNHADVAQITNNNALGLVSGTVRINTNVIVASLSTGSNYNISERARLWVNGGEVHKTQGSSTVPYGTLRVSDGIMESDVSSGVTIRDDGQILVEGGQLLTRQIRTSVLGASNVGGYTQMGGEVILDGTGGTSTDYSMFSLTYPQNVFSMTGGTLTIRNTTGRGHIFINSDSYNVTGGTVTIELSSTSQYKIDSKAPFYNLTIEKTSTSASGMEIELGTITGEGSEDESVGATELYIINDLRLASSAGGFNTQLDPRQVDILIGGDLYLENGSKLDSPSNEEAAADAGIIKFVDSGERVIDLGNQASTVSLQYLTIAKDNSTDKVTVINAPTTALRILGELRIETGALDYASYTIETQANLYVTDSIGLSASTGKLLLNGSSTQTITTDDTGVIGNCELDNANDFILAGGDLTIVNTLSFTDGILNIGENGLTLLGDLDSETKGDYSSAKMIIMGGNASDEGFTRRVSDNGALLFPIGTDANASTRYTPVFATFSGYPTADTALVKISIADEQLSTMDNTVTPAANNNKYLSYYWRINHDNPANKPTVSYTFDFDASDVNSGTADTEFVAGKVLDELPFTRSYEGDAGIQVTASVITFDGLAADDDGSGARSGFALENANYTAGFKDKFMGTPTTYFSRAVNGNWWEWQSTNNWSTDLVNKHIGAPAGSYPGAGDIAVIGSEYVNSLTTGPYSKTGDGRHQIRIDNSVGDVEIAELIFDSQDGGTALVVTDMSRLRVRRNRTLTAGKISGSGEMVQDVGSTANLTGTITGDLGDFIDQEDNGWFFWLQDVANITITDRFSYPIFRTFGASGTLDFSQDVTAQAVVIDNNTALSVTSNYYIEEAVLIGSNGAGTLNFPNAGTNLTFDCGSIVYSDNAGNNINVENSGSDIHTLIVRGDITLDQGTGFDLTSAAGTQVELELQGTGDHTFANTTGTAADLYKIIMNKGTNQASTFSFDDDMILPAPSSGFQPIELQNGTLIFNDADIGDATDKIELTNEANGEDFEIPGTAGLEIQAGTVYISGNTTGIHLDGLLKINGTDAELNMDISDTDNPGNGLGQDGDNYIEYSSSGNATLEIMDGTLTVGSQIRRGLLSTTGVLNYIQTGGTVIVGKNTAPEKNRGVLEILNTGSSFTHTGGALTLVRQNGATPSTAALYLDPDTYNVAGATLTLGNTDTPAGQNDFRINTAIPLNNLTINGANSPTVKIDVRSLSLDGDLNISSNNILDGNGLRLIISGNFSNEGTYTPNSNITEFDATSGIQTLSGSGTFNFYDLVKSGGGTLTIDKAISVANDLTVNSSSTINTAAYNLNLAGDATINGSIISDSDLSYNGIVFNGSTKQTLQRSGTGTSVIDIITINNTKGVKIPEATSYIFTINERIQLDAGVFDIGGSSVALAQHADITTSTNFGVNRMIVTNSAEADKGLKKTFASGTTDTALGDNLFVFPVGNDVYTPLTIDITGGTIGTTAGSILVKPIDAPHPAVNDGNDTTTPTDLDNVLQYYWTVSTSNITGFTGNFAFLYNESDVSADDPSFSESDYITARIRSENNASGDINKNDGVVDTGNNTLTFSFTTRDSDFLSADYFAGVDDAIPDQVPTYTVTGVGGNVDAAVFSPAVPGGGEPSGAIVVVPNGATLMLNVNGIRLYRLEIQSGGMLDVGTSSQHNLREITGTGTIRVEGVTLPAGSYDFGCTGLGIEYAGSSSYGLFGGISTVREVTVSGTGTRTFSKNMQVCEDFTINSATVQFTGDYLTQIDGDLILNGGNLSLGATSDLDIANDVTLMAGTFTVGSGSAIQIAGDLTRTSATFSTSTSTFTFDGSSNQQIAGDFTGTNAFRNVVINNTSTGVTIVDAGNNDVDIDGTLTLTDGLLTTNSNNTLTMSSTSTASGGSSASFVNGPLTRENISASASYVFKIGKGSRYAPATISQVSTGSQNWTATYFTTNTNDVGSFDPTDTGYGILGNISARDMWTIESSGSNNAKVQLTYGSHTGVTDTEEVKVVVWNGTQWINEGGVVSGDINSGTVLAEDNSSFSSKDFSIGATENSPLPITLISFTVETINNQNHFTWVTASELNNDYFELHRSSNGIDYETIKKVDGSGTTNEQRTYKAVDANPPVGLTYYRLKQVDYDGKFEFSNIISVFVSSPEKELQAFIVPNPTSEDNINLKVITKNLESEISVRLTDLQGTMLINLVKDAQELSQGIKLETFHHLPSGVYIVFIQQAGQTQRKRVIVR